MSGVHKCYCAKEQARTAGFFAYLNLLGYLTSTGWGWMGSSSSLLMVRVRAPESVVRHSGLRLWSYQCVEA